MIKKLKLIIIFIFLLMLTVNVFPKSKTPKYLYKIASEAPDGSIWVEKIKKISRELYRKTNGEIGIRVYPGGVMGDQSSIIKKITLGQLSGATFSSGGLGLIYKDFAIMGFPMIFRNYEEYDYVRTKLSSFFEKEFEKNGYTLLGWSEVGMIYVYSKNKVYSVETLRKSKPFMLNNDPISVELFKEANATPIRLGMSDVMTGLQTGTIDTVFSSPSGLILMQWHSKVKYMADFPLTLMIGAVMVDKDMFNSMPKEYQDEMKKHFRTQFDELNTQIRKENDQAQELLKKNGLIVLQVADNDKKFFSKVCTSVAQKLTEKDYSKSVYNLIKSTVEEYRNKK